MLCSKNWHERLSGQILRFSVWCNKEVIVERMNILNRKKQFKIWSSNVRNNSQVLCSVFVCMRVCVFTSFALEPSFGFSFSLKLRTSLICSFGLVCGARRLFQEDPYH